MNSKGRYETEGEVTAVLALAGVSRRVALKRCWQYFDQRAGADWL